MDKKLRILVSNDDGYFAKGINSLVGVLSEFGKVDVFAPHKGRSGQGCAITSEVPVKVEPLADDLNAITFLEGEFAFFLAFQSVHGNHILLLTARRRKRLAALGLGLRLVFLFNHFSRLSARNVRKSSCFYGRVFKF